MTSPRPLLLIVDDEQGILDVVSRFAERAGFDVTVCADGRAAIVYGAAQRRRRAAADAFVSPAVRASALPRTPGWRRHAPIALYGAALAALAVALARPEATVAVPTEQATVVLAVDRSGSMRATDVAPSRLAAVKTAASRFLDSVPRKVKVGAVTYNGQADVLAAPETDRAPVRAAIEAIEAKGGTASGDGLQAALDLIRRDGDEQPPAAVVLISDGKSTKGSDPVAVARDGGVPVYTVALGTPDGTVVDAEGTTHQATPDPETMSDLTETEKAALASMQHYDRWDSGYSKQQSTRPQTLGYGLVDSPAGQAAWILEKWRSWSDDFGSIDRGSERRQFGMRGNCWFSPKPGFLVSKLRLGAPVFDANKNKNGDYRHR